MLKEAREHLAQETSRALADYNAAELKVAALTTEMASIAAQIEAKAKQLFSGLLQAEQLAETEEETKAEEKKAEFDKELAKAELKKVEDAMDKKEAAKESIIGGFSQFAVSEDDV